jgi:predicted permease
METILPDLRYGWRMLWKNPGFTAVAVITLSLGIGANTILFSVVNGVLLNPLPFHHAEQLVALGENKPNFQNGSVSYSHFRDWRKENHAFAAMALSRVYAFSLTGVGEAEQLNGDLVSSDFFPLLGIKPVIGRTFTAEEEPVGATPVALISEGLWQRKFSSSPEVLGKNITLDGRSYTVVGVIPANFHLASIPSFREGQVYVPIGQWGNPLLLSRGAGLGFHALGRLKPGLNIEQARADMDRITRNLAAAYPDSDRGISANLAPLKQRMVGHVQPLLIMLLAAVGFVLLIACVNVANLMLARSTARTREFAVRAALGASRMDVIRQLLAESVVLAFIGGALGVLVAAWGTRAAIGVLPTALPRSNEIGLDSHVLFFAMVISLVTGILFGVTPALRLSRPGLNNTLKEGGRIGNATRHRAQSLFVVTEIATALVLMIGAGLMIRSLVRLWQVDPGFDSHHVLNFGISLPPSMLAASPDAIRSAFRELDNEFASIPGVQAVSQTWESLPMAGDDEQLFWFEGQPKPASQNDMNWAIHYVVGPDYLNVMRIPLRRGRFFTGQDDGHSMRVIVVDDVFAQKYFANQDPIGRRIHLNSSNQVAEIVGVVGHVKQWGLDADDTQSLRAQLYVPWIQMPEEYVARAPSGAGMVVRSAGNGAGLFDAIRHASARMSNQQVIYGTQTMDELITESIATQRFSMILLAAFAALALVLASVGIYGVVSYVVGQRSHEIGIRMALGAERSHILRLVLTGGGKLALAGVVGGCVAGLGLTRLMNSMLYGVRPTDPLTFATVAIVLTLVALLASYIPARRAAKVDPIVALRYE